MKLLVSGGGTAWAWWCSVSSVTTSGGAVVVMTGGVAAATVITDCEVSKCGGLVMGGGGYLGTNIDILIALG